MDKKMQTISFPAPDPDMGTLAAAQELAYREIKVIDPTSSKFAQEFRNGIAAKVKELNEQRMTITRPLDESKANTIALFRGPILRLETVIAQVDNQILEFNKRERLRAAEAQRKVDEDAAKERARLQEIADRAHEKGQHSKAEKFQERAVSIVAPIVEPRIGKASGTSFRTNWTYRIKDIDKIDRKYMIPNEIMIGQICRSLKKSASEILGPGIEVYSEESIGGARTSTKESKDVGIDKTPF